MDRKHTKPYPVRSAVFSFKTTVFNPLGALKREPMLPNGCPKSIYECESRVEPSS